MLYTKCKKEIDNGNKFMGNITDKVFCVMVALVFALLLSACASMTTRMMSEDKDTHESAFVEFNKMDDKSKAKLIQSIIEALKNQDANIRSNAVDVLAEIGLADETAIPSIIEALKNQDANVRSNAVNVLAEIGLAAKAAVPAIEEALKDQDVNVRSNASNALVKIRMSIIANEKNIKHEQEVEVLRLIKVLKGDNYNDDQFLQGVRYKDHYMAAEMLGNIGPNAKAAIPALREALKDESFWVPPEKVRAAAYLNYEQLMRLFKVSDEDNLVRKNAAEALKKITGSKEKSPKPDKNKNLKKKQKQEESEDESEDFWKRLAASESDSRNSWERRAAWEQFNRGETYYYNGKYNKAIAEYQYCIDTYRNIRYGDEIQKRISEAFAEMNQWNEAAESYEKLANKFPKSRHVSLALEESAKIYEQISNYKEAVRVYQRIIKEYWVSPQRPNAISKIKEILITKFPEDRWAEKKNKEIDKIIFKNQGRIATESQVQ